MKNVAPNVERLTSKHILEVKNLNYQIGNQVILRDISFNIPAGSFCCLLGRSGCGKSSLLQNIVGLSTPQSGEIYLNARKISGAGRSMIPVERRRIGLMFQNYGLFPHLSVRDNILFGLPKCGRLQQDEVVGRLLALVRLKGYGRHYPHQLSGGQQQRIALARTIAPDPLLVLLDEPFSNIDQEHRTKLALEVKSIFKQQFVSAFFVTHDREEALLLSDYIGIIMDGVLVQWDTPTNLYFQPCSSRVAEFMGSGNRFTCQLLPDKQLLTPFGILTLSGKDAVLAAERCNGDQVVDLFLRDENFLLCDHPPPSFERCQRLVESGATKISMVKEWSVQEKHFKGNLTYLVLGQKNPGADRKNLKDIRVFIRSNRLIESGQTVYLKLQIDQPIIYSCTDPA